MSETRPGSHGDSELPEKSVQHLNELAASIAKDLKAGQAPEDIIQELVDSGWTRENAAALVSDIQARLKQLAEDGIDLSARFPDMTPVSGFPPLFTLNGCGVGIYGARDHDPETNSYVKTYCICGVFVPVLALSAYRVIKAPNGGWYVLGKVPLSRVAKFWNTAVVLAVLCGIGLLSLDIHRNQPAQQAQRRLEQADEARERGELVEAARLYREVFQFQTEHSQAAREGLVRILNSAELLQASPDETAAVLRSAVQIHQTYGILPEAELPGFALVKKHGPSPQAALQVLEAVAPLSAEKTQQALAEILQEPIGSLPSREAVPVLETALRLSTTDAMRTETCRQGLRHVETAASTNLESAVLMLEVLAPGCDPAVLSERLAALLDERLETLSCPEASSVLRVAQRLVPDGDRTTVIQRGLDWLQTHEDVDASAALAMLDEFQDADGPLHPACNAVRIRYLEEIVAASPNDLASATRLARVVESSGDTQRVIALLEPLRDKFTDGDATRLLGQAYADVGRLDESYDLLQPYVESRLDALHAAETELNRAVQDAQQLYLNRLQEGLVQSFDYEAFAAADDERKQFLVGEYLNESLRQSGQIETARQQLLEQAEVVPVALALGMVTLRRARSLADPAAQRAELEKAEKTFLAIGGVAGENDAYRLQLGQVYYWLGKHDEGRAVFEELLESQERSHSILMAVANLLYEIGARRDARELSEEAYESAASAEEKRYAAHLRALSSIELKDRITWLKRADQKQPQVQATLLSALGDQAANQGDRAEAADHFRRAIALYEKLPETDATLNNAALVYGALFEVTDDRAALSKCIETQRRALALAPSDGILVTNLASKLLIQATLNLMDEDLDLQELGVAGDLDVLYWRVKDADDLTALQTTLRQDPGIREVVELLDQAMVLSPKNSALYSQAFAVHSVARNADALRELSTRIANATPDVLESRDKILDHYQGNIDPDIRQQREQALVEAQDRLETYRQNPESLEYSIAAGQVVDLQLWQWPDADVDALVALAEDAHARRPSYMTATTLAKTLFARAAQTVSREDAEFAAMCTASQYLLSPDLVMAIVLQRDAAKSEALLGNPDFQRAVQHSARKLEQFEALLTYRDWALLRHTHPDLADRAHTLLAANECNALIRKMGLQLHPLSGGTAYQESWAQLAAGDAAGAQQILADTQKLGVPLP